MSVHEDTLQGLNEVLEHVKGNTKLKTRVVEIPDEEAKLFHIYSKLSDANKLKVLDYASALLQA